MKHAFTLALSLLLTLSLVFYGSAGMAKVGGNAVVSMEICADGFAKTVSLDANGNPVEPTQTCPECLKCCHAFGALPPMMWSHFPSLNRLDIEGTQPVTNTPIVNKRNLYPAPRGPPAVQVSIPMLITFHWSAGGRMRRSVGRSILRDANA